MCGIVGVAGNLITGHNKAFRDMLMMDAVRGVDSTGVLFVPMYNSMFPNKKPIIEKELGLPDNLWLHVKSEIFNWNTQIGVIGRVLLGHNRAATIGNVTAENAHPFQMGDVYGVHNGTLRDYKSLEGYDEHPIDSMCLLDNISKHGIEDTWGKFIGAAALVWWDKEKQTLNFARNKERSLYFAYSAKKDVILWASETWMLRAAAWRNKVELAKNKEGNDEIFFFENDKHYSFEINNTGYKKLETKKLTPKTYVVTTNYHCYGYQSPKVAEVIGKGRKTLHSGWAASMEKAGKETRGLLIELTSFLATSNKFIARFVNETDEFKGVIHIFPNNLEEVLQLQKAFKSDNKQFKTKTRMRIEENKNWTRWGISSQGLAPTVSTTKEVEGKELPKPSLKVLDGGKSEDCSDDIPMYKSFRGKEVSAARWRELLSAGPGGGCQCAWCGEKLEPKDHEKILFISTEDALCKDCSTDPMVIDNLGHMYPEVCSNYMN